MGRACVLMTVTALGLVAAGTAQAAAPLPPANVSATAADGSAQCDLAFGQPGIGGVDIAANARGDTIVSWTRNAGGGTQLVQAAFRPAGGSFGPPQDIGLTDPCYFFLFGGATPDVALDAQGGAVIVFPAITDSGDGAVRAAIKPPGGAFAGPVDLATGVPTLDDVPRVAMNAAGTAVAVWSRRSGANTIIQSSTRPPGGAFGSAINLSAGGADAKTPRVAVNDAGAAAVAWVRDDGTVDRAQARVRPAGQAAFATAQDLSATGTSGQDASNPDVAIDPSGVVTVAWSRVLPGGTRAQSRFLNAAGAIAAGIDDVSDAGDDSVAPNLAVDASGAAVVVFRACPTAGGDCAVKAAARPSGGSFGAVETISPRTDQNVFPKVVIDPAGTATAAFTPFTEQTQTFLTRRPPGGSFGAVQAVSPSDGSSLLPAVATDDQGNALVGWAFRSSAAGNPWAAQVSAFDAAAPTLDVAVPSTGTAGQAIGMTASASDRWSPVGLSWSLGDGATASGGAVSHAFGSAGAFDVTATATDAAGNASSATRSILVTPAPPAARKVIRSKVRVTWGVKGRRIFLLRLQVTRVPKGGKVELRCSRRKSQKCPFKRKSSKQRRNGAITLFNGIKASKAVGKKQRTFRAGQRLQVRVTAKGFVGKAVRYDLKKGKIPNGRDFCIPAGGKKLRTRC
jgi:hypothetical protein